VGVGDASSSSNNPPLYYLVQDVAYAAARGADVTGRLAAMRLLSALLAGLTTLCIYLFLREVLPGSPLSWTVGALAAGLQPTFAFIASGVNNDGGLYLVSSALLLALARLFRRGLSVRRAAAAGALLGVGVLVKTQVIAFAPAVGLALVLCAWRARSDARATRLKALAAGLAAAVAPLAVYGVLGATVWNRPVVDRVSGVVGTQPTSARPWLLGEQLSYLWQLYLPRLPNLHDLIPGFPPYSLWLKGFVGHFGWLDYQLPMLTYPIAAAIFVTVGVLAVLALWRRRSLRARVGELLVYGMFAAGLAAAIAAAGYRAAIENAPAFEQARYLLPLLGLYALFPALAVRAGGARWAPVIAILIVAGVIGHSLLAQLTTLMRYYG
jgi:4-amino-4-deoxy-L-arabinose transferase-like glycosyltransferase